MSSKGRPGTSLGNAYMREKLLDLLAQTSSTFHCCKTFKRMVPCYYKPRRQSQTWIPLVSLQKGRTFVKHCFTTKGLANKPCPFPIVTFQEDIINSGPVKRCDFCWLFESFVWLATSVWHRERHCIVNATVVSQEVFGLWDCISRCIDVEEGTVRVEEE